MGWFNYYGLVAAAIAALQTAAAAIGRPAVKMNIGVIMKEVKIEKCPFCGGEEFIEAAISSMGMRGVCINRLGDWGRSMPIFASVCRDCGSLIRTYCRDTEKLFPKKERKE